MVLSARRMFDLRHHGVCWDSLSSAPSSQHTTPENYNYPLISNINVVEKPEKSFIHEGYNVQYLLKLYSRGVDSAH